MEIVLASSSPRRKAILRKLGFRFTCAKSDVVEKTRRGSAESNAKRLALGKARAVAERHAGAIVIGADTMIGRNGKFCLKTGSKRKAKEMLRELSGKWHNAWTGVAILKGKRKIVFCERAQVRMRKLGRKEICDYVAGGEALGKAGCYNIAGKGRKLIEKVVGEPECVAGLPVKKLRKELRRIVAL